MSAPQVLAVVPDVNETDVVLGQSVSITFDQLVDTTTLNESTFTLTYPAPTQVMTSMQLVTGGAAPSTVVITGTWTFAVLAGATVATFQPDSGFKPNTLYTCMLLGADAALSTEDVQNPTGESMAESYSWSFTTGDLKLKTPPVTSPLLDDAAPIQPSDIRILPRAHFGQDLAQTFDIVFSDDIDPTSFSQEDLAISVEPILGNPTLAMPSNLQFHAVIQGNKLRIRILGLPV